MKIAFLVFDRITALDAVGPYEVLSRVPGAEPVLVAPRAGEIRTDDRRLGLVADASIDDVRAADVLVVPGGYGERALERDPAFLDWLREIDRTTTVTATVCTGALLAAAAGLLAGRRATTHFAFRDRLAALGAVPVAARIVRDGKYASAAGVSAGIDLALALALELAGERVAGTIQLGIEYDPAPPLDFGDEARAPAEMRDAVVARIRAREASAA